MKRETIKKILDFRDNRDWKQYHSGKDLSISISLEASELLECFQWSNDEYDEEHVLEELADVFNYCIQMAQVLNVDICDIINSKCDKNEKKYPIDKAYGSSKKYNEL